MGLGLRLFCLSLLQLHPLWHPLCTFRILALPTALAQELICIGGVLSAPICAALLLISSIGWRRFLLRRRRPQVRDFWPQEWAFVPVAAKIQVGCRAQASTVQSC